MPRAKESKFKGTQRQFMTEKAVLRKPKDRPVKGISKEENQLIGLLGHFPRRRKTLLLFEGNRIINMKLLQDALTEAHVCPEGISLTFLLIFHPSCMHLVINPPFLSSHTGGNMLS